MEPALLCPTWLLARDAAARLCIFFTATMARIAYGASIMPLTGVSTERKEYERRMSARDSSTFAIVCHREPLYSGGYR